MYCCSLEHRQKHMDKALSITVYKFVQRNA